MIPKILIRFCAALVLVSLAACGQPAVPQETPAVPTTVNTAAIPPQPTPEPILPTEAPTLAPTSTPAEAPTTAAETGMVLGNLAPGTAVKIAGLRMFTSNEGWAIGGEEDSLVQRLLRTSDGGATWQEVTPPQRFESSIESVSLTAAFDGPQRAWVAFGEAVPVPPTRSAQVWFTTDGGQTWQAGQSLELPDILDFYMPGALSFPDALHGWLLVHLGAGMNHDYVALYATTDGGASWQRRLDPTNETLPMSCGKHDLVFISPTRGWIGGDCHGVSPEIHFYRSDDGGLTWTLVPLPAPADAPDLTGSDEWMCAVSDLAFSTPLDGSFALQCRRFADNTARAWVYISQDGGDTWSPSRLPEADGRLQMLPGGDGWYIGGGRIYRSSDYGAAWALVKETTWGGVPVFVSGAAGWVLAGALDSDETALVQTGNSAARWAEVLPVIGP